MAFVVLLRFIILAYNILNKMIALQINLGESNKLQQLVGWEPVPYGLKSWNLGIR